MPGASFWLQAGACVVVLWSLLHGDVNVTVSGGTSSAAAASRGQADGATVGGLTVGTGAEAPASGAAASALAGASAADARAAAAVAGAASAEAAGAAASGSATTPAAAQLAGAPALEGAKLALSTIDVIVTRNDTLDRIFRRLRLNLADLAWARSLPGVRTRLDRLQPGESLHLTHREGELFGLERRLNDAQTLKVSRDGQGLRADVLENALETRLRTVRGTIDSSLFEAVEAAGAHDQTAVELADIFGWDVDFVLDVRTGDAFAVTYPEIWRDGTYLRDGPIEAALFVNQGREYRAVRYADPDGHSHYYTPDGKSLHKAFLRTPVEFTRVSSRFNSARFHPILHRIRAHRGVDYAAPTGTPVHAAGDGRIRFAGIMGGYGNLVEIEHSRSVTTVYGHLSRFARGTRPGEHVTQGTVIGYVGMTGLATGPHLHYEYRVNGVHQNPQTVRLPAAAPIEARWRSDFLSHSAPLLATLDPQLGPLLVSR